MKIYLVEINDHDYDQYDAFIVVADSDEEAITLLKTQYPTQEYGSLVDWQGGYKIREVNENEPKGELLGSFNAG